MKNKMKVVLKLIFVITIFAVVINVSAGSVTISLTGNDTVVVNNNIDVTVHVSDINGLTDGLATAQGDISFDGNYLEYIKHEDVSSNLSVSYGTKTNRFVALGLSGEYIPSSDNLLKITFKAKKVGETTISMNNVVIGDTKAIIHSSNVGTKTIKIIDASSNNSTPTAPSNPTTGSSSSSKGTSSSSSNSSSTSSKSSDATLSKLIINNAKVTPNFNKETTNYYVVVSKDVDKLQLDYITTDKKATVKVEGNTQLKDDEVNIVKVVVTAENGTTKTYTLNVTKSNEESNNKLKELKIKEKDISSIFDEDKYEYNITIGSSIDKLTIDAIAKNKDSKVEILGNKNLAKGNNVILIKLTDKNGFSNYYRLNVKKEDKVTLFGIDIRYIIFGLLFLLLLLILIIILIKRRKKDDDEDDKDKRIYISKGDMEKIRSFKSSFKSEEENVDIYDDVVTKDEIIEAIEEKNPKKLKMLLAQEEANKLKEELIQEEEK